MTDRELLELAAKAAGWDTNPWTWSERAEAFRYRVGGDWVEWNPLTDDGDAFRLAVQLRKMPAIEHWSAGPDWVFIPGHEGGALPLGNDPLAATRRAIVRVAAEIGRAMP